MPKARVSHIAICENGLGVILNGPSQEVCVFTTDLKLPTLGKGQRFCRQANDEMVVSTFAYLPLPCHVHSKNPCAKMLTQSVSQHNPRVRRRGGVWFYDIVTGTL